MLLDRVNIYNDFGYFLSLRLENPDNGVIIREIDGLGPSKASLVSSPYANMDGEHYHSGKREPRNIIFRLALDPLYSSGAYKVDTVQEVRSLIYKVLMPKTESRFEFYTVDGQRNIVGVVESVEPVIFAKEPTVDVSVMCFEPDFVSHTDYIISMDTDVTSEQIVNVGSTDSGFIFKLFVDRNIGLNDQIRVRNKHESDVNSVNQKTLNVNGSGSLGISFQAGDVLEISTIPGDKYVRRIRSGDEVSGLYAMASASEWPIIHPGNNRLTVTVPGASIPFEIRYRPRYGGL
jgi:hypothetical protein